MNAREATRARAAVERLEEIRDDMLAHLEEAGNEVRMAGTGLTYARARSYWLANVEISLRNDHEWAANGGTTLEDTIHELEEAATDAELDGEEAEGDADAGDDDTLTETASDDVPADE